MYSALFIGITTAVVSITPNMFLSYILGKGI